MQLSDPFPAEELPSSFTEAISAEFRGYHPAVLEGASTSDAFWLELRSIKSERPAWLRSLTEGICSHLQSSALIRITLEEVLVQRHQP
jgi:hypothetical protein